MTQDAEAPEPHPFAGMGSRAVKDRQLAEHRALLERRGPATSDQEQERALVRAHSQGDVEGGMERLARGAQADLAAESARTAANARHVEAEIEQAREAKRQRELRHQRLAARLPPDRVTTRASEVPALRCRPGTGPWEKLAASGFEAVSQPAGAPGDLPRSYEPDPEYRGDTDNERVIARY